MLGNYTQKLSMQWSTLTQGNKSVAQYIQEWVRMYVLCDINDSEYMRVGKFLGGLREDLRLKLSIVPNLTVALVGEQALLLEQYSKKRATPTFGQPMTRNNQSVNPRSVNTNAPSKPGNSVETKGKSVTPTKDVVCFKCHGHGHFKVNCSKYRAFTLAEWEEIRGRDRPKNIAEWEEIRGRDRPKTILVNTNGREEERALSLVKMIQMALTYRGNQG